VLTSRCPRYLWVVLQIDALFPRYHDKLISDADIAGMMIDLPMGLPAAFNRALGRILDTRYGKNIFQIVAAAYQPLRTNELALALSVRCGDTDWSSLAVPENSEAIVGLCGGGLLEVEEETETVHYIHPSVLQHLQTIAEDPNHSYYFEPREADLYLGSICVTYLNYSIFATQLVPRSDVVVDVGGLTHKVTATVGRHHSLTTKIVTSFKRKTADKPREMDIGRIVREHLGAVPVRADMHCLLDYAANNWLRHTSWFSPGSCPDTYKLFTKLVDEFPIHLGKLPWKTAPQRSSIMWSIENSHAGLFGHLIELDPDIETHPDLIRHFLREWPPDLDISESNLAYVKRHLLAFNLTEQIQSSQDDLPKPVEKIYFQTSR